MYSSLGSFRGCSLLSITLVSLCLGLLICRSAAADPPPHLNGSNLIPPPSPPPPPPPVFEEGEAPEANVTLIRMEIFDQHAGWLDYSTDVYFRCVGEAQTFIPDVKEVLFNYTFNGSESFQPLTSLAFDKCKKCGLYEKDFWSSDDTFAEWILCASNFSDAKSALLNLTFVSQFNASLYCPECLLVPEPESDTKDKNSALSVVFLLLVVFGSLIFVFLLLILAAFLVISYRKRKIDRMREEERSKFIELFDEDDEVEKDLEHL